MRPSCSLELGRVSSAGMVTSHKPSCTGTYQQLMETGLLKVDGLLVVDDTMYKGEELVGGELSENGKGAQALNQALLADERISQVMLPLRDGLTLALRLR